MPRNGWHGNVSRMQAACSLRPPISGSVDVAPVRPLHQTGTSGKTAQTSAAASVPVARSSDGVKGVPRGLDSPRGPHGPSGARNERVSHSHTWPMGTNA